MTFGVDRVRKVNTLNAKLATFNWNGVPIEAFRNVALGGRFMGRLLAAMFCELASCLYADYKHSVISERWD